MQHSNFLFLLKILQQISTILSRNILILSRNIQEVNNVDQAKLRLASRSENTLKEFQFHT